MPAFHWIGEAVEALGRIIPRMLIVRATEAGVKWVWGKQVKMMPPGVHFYWPLVTEVDIMVTARQTWNLPTQVLMTKDRQQLVIGTAVIYLIDDILLAIGRANWDVDCTINDITQAAVAEVVGSTSFDELMGQVAGELERRLTRSVRKRLKKFGVQVQRCTVTDFSTCRVYKVIGNEQAPDLKGVHSRSF